MFNPFEVFRAWYHDYLVELNLALGTVNAHSFMEWEKPGVPRIPSMVGVPNIAGI